MTACDGEPLTDPPTEEELLFCQNSVMSGVVYTECDDFVGYLDHFAGEGHFHRQHPSYPADQCDDEGALFVSDHAGGWANGGAAWVNYDTSPPKIEIPHLTFNFLGYTDIVNGIGDPVREGVGVSGESGKCNYVDIQVSIPSSLDLENDVGGWELSSGTNRWIEPDVLPCLGTELTWNNPETGFNGVARFFFSETDRDNHGVADDEDNCADVTNEVFVVH